MTDLHAKLGAILDARDILGREALATRHTPNRAAGYGADLLVRPRSTAQISTICKLARTEGVAIVPHGGMTGLVDGTVSRPGQLIVSFEKMTRILHVDLEQGYVVVEPGITPAALDEALQEYNAMIGVDIASGGSASIGGMISTNAGGARVLKHGMMRDNILGLEVVLSSGEVLDLTGTLVKDNTGYDLKQLFIGAEGTLGLVTKAVLKPLPRPEGSSVSLVSCADPRQLGAFLTLTRQTVGANLLAFEAMWPSYYKATVSRTGFGHPPLPLSDRVHVLLDVSGKDDDSARTEAQTLLEAAFEQGFVADAVMARSLAESQAIWRAREDSDAVETAHAHCISYDVGLELRHMTEFVERLETRAARDVPEASIYVFGHLADGNLHAIAGFDEGADVSRPALDALVYGVLQDFPGSTISAEHGIGEEKKARLRQTISPVKLKVMQALKIALDPENLLNPGKILDLPRT